LFITHPHYGQGGGLQQMRERLLPRQMEEMKAGQEEIKACQDNADATAKAHQNQLKQAITGHMESCLEGLKSCERRTKTC
jgi:hypothetical protein